MKLGEFIDAIDGFNALEDERLKWQFFCTRRMCFYMAAGAGVKDLKEEDIIPIADLDEQIRKNRLNDLPLAKVVHE